MDSINIKTAYWYSPYGDFVSPPEYCDNCQKRTQGGWIEPYCPKCGAKMLGVKSEVEKPTEENLETNNIIDYDWETIEEATEM